MGGNEKESFADKGKNIVKNNLIPGFKAGLKQKAVAFAGGGLGTALAMKRGKNLNNAIRSGGLLGMAAGDTIGSVAVPQHALYKKHKKEFGTAPDAKSVGKVFAANTLPTAASWGAILGSKKGRKLFGDGFAIPAENMRKGFSAGKKEFNSLRQRARTGDLPESEIKTGVKNVFKKGLAASRENKGGGKAAAKMWLADKAMDKLVEAPTYVVTPDSIIAKKKKERDGQMAGENLKTAMELVDYEFNKIARELNDRQKKKVYKQNKDDFKKVYEDAGLSLKGALKYRPSAKEIRDTYKDQGDALKGALKGGLGGATIGGLVGAGAIYKQMASKGHPWGRDVTRQMALKAGKNLGLTGAIVGQGLYGPYAQMVRAKDRQSQRFEKALDKRFGRENTVRVEQGGKKAMRNAYAQSLMNSKNNKK